MAFSSAACVLYSPPVRFNFWAALYSLLLSLSLLFISPVFALSCCRCISSFSLDSLQTRSRSPSLSSWRHTWPPSQPHTMVFWPSQPSQINWFESSSKILPHHIQKVNVKPLMWLFYSFVENFSLISVTDASVTGDICHLIFLCWKPFRKIKSD